MMLTRLCCAVFLSGIGLLGQGGNPLPVVSVVGSAGILSGTQAQVTLTVQVADRAGAPVSATVLFVSPTAGASGIFQNATPDGATFVRVATDSNGQASATLITNAIPGVFLVEAGIEETPAGVTFAITTLTPGAAPSLGADDARAAVKSWLLPNTAEDEKVRLHGPVLLPAGTVLSSNQPLSPPFTVAADAWFFWYDPAASARFSHPSQFVVLDANSTPDAARARVTTETFWPLLLVPGATVPVALLPAGRTNDTLQPAPAANASMSKRRTVPVSRAQDIAAADTCAIVIYGSPDHDQKVDVQNMSTLFRDTLQIPTVLTNQDADGNLQPSDIDSLENMIQQSIKKGCKRVYIYISAHGAEAGVLKFIDERGGYTLSGWIGLSQKTDSGYESQILTYDTLGKLLEPYGQNHVEVGFILDACFSANAIPALQNHGFSGIVATATDRDNFSQANFISVFSGGYFTDGLTTVWKSLLPSPDHPVGLDAAMSSLLARGDGLFPIENPLAGHPQIATIDPNGGVFPVSDLKIPSVASGPATLVFNRPSALSETLGLKVTIADTSVATLNGTGQQVTSLRSGANTTTLTVTPVKEGVTTYTVTMQDHNNKTYTGTATIQVGDGYVTTPANFTIKVGETQTVAVARLPILTGFSAQLNFTPSVPGIATANPAGLGFAAPDTSKTTNVTGNSPGTTLFTGTDGAGRKTSFSVVVMPATCPTSPVSFNTNFTVLQDLDASAAYVGLTTGVMTITPKGTQVMITGDRNQIAPATGTFNPSTCTFSAMGVSTGPIAGFRNVNVSYINFKIGGPDFGMLMGEYDVATMGDFNGERPVKYTVTGQRK